MTGKGRRWITLGVVGVAAGFLVCCGGPLILAALSILAATAAGWVGAGGPWLLALAALLLAAAVGLWLLRRKGASRE